MKPMKPKFFKTPKEFRAWLEKNHQVKDELIVGFYKVGTGKPSLTWPQSVDEALSFGWIDGIRRSLGEASYCIRFTPRRPTSIWSSVNIRRVAELTADGRMWPAGLAAFERRDPKRSGSYSYEHDGKALTQKNAKLVGEPLETLKADKKAWAFHEAQAPYYQRLMAFWILSAKRPETRAKRLATLIAYSRKGERVPLLAPPRPKE